MCNIWGHNWGDATTRDDSMAGGWNRPGQSSRVHVIPDAALCQNGHCSCHLEHPQTSPQWSGFLHSTAASEQDIVGGSTGIQKQVYQQTRWSYTASSGPASVVLQSLFTTSCWSQTGHELGQTQEDKMDGDPSSLWRSVKVTDKRQEAGGQPSRKNTVCHHLMWRVTVHALN